MHSHTPTVPHGQKSSMEKLHTARAQRTPNACIFLSQRRPADEVEKLLYVQCRRGLERSFPLPNYKGRFDVNELTVW
jgi:hypothetical protein